MSVSITYSLHKPFWKRKYEFKSELGVLGFLDVRLCDRNADMDTSLSIDGWTGTYTTGR